MRASGWGAMTPPSGSSANFPTRTPSTSSFGGVPAVPMGVEGTSPDGSGLAGGTAAAGPSGSSSSGVLWGGAAAALIAAATAIALEGARRRQEEEERMRAEIARRNAEAEAREAEQRHLAWLAAAAAAAAKKAMDQAGTDGTSTDEDRPSESRFGGMQLPQGAISGQSTPLDLRRLRSTGSPSNITGPTALTAKGCRFRSCAGKGIVTLLNGGGTLLLLAVPDPRARIAGVVLLGVNFVVQGSEVIADWRAYQRGSITKEHFHFNMLLNVLDAAPGLGAAKGIFSLMGECVFDWAFDWSRSSPDRRR